MKMSLYKMTLFNVTFNKLVTVVKAILINSNQVKFTHTHTHTHMYICIYNLYIYI